MHDTSRFGIAALATLALLTCTGSVRAQEAQRSSAAGSPPSAAELAAVVGQIDAGQFEEALEVLGRCASATRPPEGKQPLRSIRGIVKRILWPPENQPTVTRSLHAHAGERALELAFAAGRVVRFWPKASIQNYAWHRTAELCLDVDASVRALEALAELKQLPDGDYHRLGRALEVEVLLDEVRYADALSAVRAFPAVDTSDPAALASLSTQRMAFATARTGLRIGRVDLALKALRPYRRAADAQTPSLELAWMRLQVDLELEQFDRAAAAAEQLLAELRALAASESASEASVPAFVLAQRRAWGARIAYVEAVAKERLEDASAAGLLAAMLDDSVVLPEVRTGVALTLAKGAIRAGQWRRAQDLLDRSKRPRATIGWLAARGRCLAAMVRAGTAEASDLVALEERLREAWGRHLRAWRELPAEDASVAFLQSAERREMLAAWFDVVGALRGEDAAEACLEAWLAVDGAATSVRRDGLAPGTVAAVQALLVPRDGALLCYLPAPQGSFAIRVGAHSVQVRPLPGDRNVRTAVRRLRDTLRPSRRGSAGGDALQPASVVQEAAAPLAWLLPEDWGAEGGARLAIAGRELLAGLPFACLPRAGRRQFLGLQVALSYIPNCALACRVAAQPAGSHAVDVGLAAVNVDADELRTLDGAELAGVLPMDRSFSATAVESDWRGTLADLLVGSRSATAFAVFAHGCYDGRRAAAAGLKLRTAEGALFEAYCEDVQPAFAKGPELFVLAVCGVGRGALRRGDESSSDLGGLLLRAGVRTVALSDYDLEVHRCAELVRDLLRGAADGLPPDLALREARCAMFDRGLESPGAWAVLRLEGAATCSLPLRASPRSVGEKTPLPLLRLGYVALGLGLALAAFFAVRRACR
ncbi:MAG: CHAT domain-containing protein [Planctomycetota bacterium]